MSKNKKAKKNAARKATNPWKAYDEGTAERFPFHVRLPRTVLHADHFIDERGEMSEQAMRGFMECLGVTQLQPQAPVPEISYEFGFTDNPNPWKELKSLNRRDEFHRRAQKAEGAAKYLYKSVRRYQNMLEKAYYLIGVEIGRGTRFMVDPVPLIKDAPLMNAFKNELHRGYRDGENLSPEHHVTIGEQSGLHISITEAKE